MTAIGRGQNGGVRPIADVGRAPLDWDLTRSRGRTVFLDRLRSLLAGVSVGLFLAILYLQITADAQGALDALLVGAIAMAFASVLTGLWLRWSAKK